MLAVKSAKPAVARPAPKAQKPNVGAAVVAVIASAMISVAPVMAAPDYSVKQAVCASNPTAKVCLKNSYQPAEKK